MCVCVCVCVCVSQFINVGVKVLARCDNHAASCPFRLCQEVSHSHTSLKYTLQISVLSDSVCVCVCVCVVQGIDSLVPFVTSSRLSLSLEDLVLVLREPNPLSVGLAPHTQEALSHLGMAHPCLSTASPVAIRPCLFRA